MNIKIIIADIVAVLGEDIIMHHRARQIVLREQSRLLAAIAAAVA